MDYSRAGGKLIHEKNQKQKISWHCPFKRPTNMSSGIFVSSSPSTKSNKDRFFGKFCPLWAFFPSGYIQYFPWTVDS